MKEESIIKDKEKSREQSDSLFKLISKVDSETDIKL